MSEIPPDTRALYDAAQGGDEPTADDRSRVRGKLAARLGAGALVGGALGATASTGTAAAGAKLAGVAALATKLLVALVIGGGMGTAGYLAVGPTEPAPRQRVSSAGLVVRSAMASESVQRHVAAPEGDAEVVARQAGPAAPGAGDSPASGGAAPRRAAPAGSAAAPESPPSATAAPGSAAAAAAAPATSAARPSSTAAAALPVANPDSVAPSAPAAPAAPGVRSTLTEETAMVGEAQAALQHGRAEQALRALERHQQQHPSGALREERIATQILALCSLGRIEEARAMAAAFLREAPRSPVAARVRGSCAAR